MDVLSQHQCTSAKSHLCHSEGCERAGFMRQKTAEVEVVQTSETVLLYPVCWDSSDLQIHRSFELNIDLIIELGEKKSSEWFLTQVSVPLSQLVQLSGPSSVHSWQVW